MGDRIRNERRARKISQDDFLDALNNYDVVIGRNRLSKLENGDRNAFGLEILIAVCHIFEWDMGHLMGEYSEKTRQAADVCQITGLSEKAFDNLIEFDENVKGFISFIISTGYVNGVALTVSRCIDLMLKVTHYKNNVLPILPETDIENVWNGGFNSSDFENEAKRTQIIDEIRKLEDFYTANLWRCEKDMGTAIEAFIKEEIKKNGKT